jgi:hypothetical protein
MSRLIPIGKVQTARDALQCLRRTRLPSGPRCGRGAGVRGQRDSGAISGPSPWATSERATRRATDARFGGGASAESSETPAYSAHCGSLGASAHECSRSSKPGASASAGRAPALGSKRNGLANARIRTRADRSMARPEEGRAVNLPSRTICRPLIAPWPLNCVTNPADVWSVMSDKRSTLLRRAVIGRDCSNISRRSSGGEAT